MPCHICFFFRLNGFGKFGEWSKKAGHDINFLAFSGVLSRLGRPDQNPQPPINLLADFAGGGFVCALGIVLALYERSKCGKGQVVDCNMLSGSSYLASFLWSSIGTMGQIVDNPRGQNLLDGGCPFYDTYKTSDNKFMAVGALEPQFFHNLMAVLNISKTYPVSEQFDRAKWADMRQAISKCFMTKTRKEWVASFHNVDACVTPVLEIDEAPMLEQNLENDNFVTKNDGRSFPNVAPRLSMSPGKIDSPSVGDLLPVGRDTRQVLLDIGFSHEDIDKLVKNGVVFCLDDKSKL